MPAITKHLKNIFETGELKEEVVSSILEHTTQHGAIEGKKQESKVKYHNLDATISVGYRPPIVRICNADAGPFGYSNAFILILKERYNRGSRSSSF